VLLAWRAASAAVLLGLLARTGASQPPDSALVGPGVRIIGSGRYTVRDLPPGLVNLRESLASEAPAASQHPSAPLTSAQTAHLHEAQALRRAGQLEPARNSLTPLLSERPHHPEVVTELARLLLAKQDFAGVERLGHTERTAQKDSLLVARELALALERLGRTRDAAAVVLEAWLVSPAEGSWAEGTILHLATADLRVVHELVRKASAARPARQDLSFVQGMLDWRAGDLETALQTLERAEQPAGRRAPLRWEFALDLEDNGLARDSLAAMAALVRLAGDGRFGAVWRLSAAQRAWEVAAARGAQQESAPVLVRALRGVPVAQWPSDFLVALVRSLRQGGQTDEARSLLHGDRANGPASVPRGAIPQLDLEEALADLRDGPPETTLPRLHALADATPEGAWRYAEALFYAGLSDSALACYQRIAANPEGTFSGAALERVYLIEDADPLAALPVLGHIAYDRWRGDHRQAMVLTDSLFRTLPRGATWAETALWLASQREEAGDPRGALEPLLAVADSLPEDRLAPLARQRAGDLYLSKLKDEKAALAQYEECLIRYPQAWNAAEVRRKAEQLRREPRF
jgi:tetratricopeptide (TPR) repeat protein